jgi:hypothetical protein
VGAAHYNLALVLERKRTYSAVVIGVPPKAHANGMNGALVRNDLGATSESMGNVDHEETFRLPQAADPRNYSSACSLGGDESAGRRVFFWTAPLTS